MGAAIDYARHVQLLCGLRHRQPQRWQHVIAQGQAGVRRIEHVCHRRFSFSVAVLVVHQHRVRAFKHERHTPIAIHRHRPMAAQVAVQRVQAPAGQVHILGRLRLVEAFQLPRQLYKS